MEIRAVLFKIYGEEYQFTLDQIRNHGYRRFRINNEVFDIGKKIELNEDDDYDMICNTERPVGTHISRRVCRARLYREAMAEDARRAMNGEVMTGPMINTQKHNEILLEKLRLMVLEHPEPFVWQKSLDDYAVAYELNVYTKDPRKIGDIYSELRQHVLDAFNGAGIEIMTPSVAALRDANQPAIPPEAKPKISDFPGFRFMDPGRGQKG